MGGHPTSLPGDCADRDGKPAEYVKVCSLYGAGFYYIPGTDICLKVGAYFRAEYAWGNQGTSLTNLDSVGVDGERTRTDGPDYNQRTRAFIFLDSRQQTAYGTLRAYMNVGLSYDFGTASAATSGGPYANRAFMQLAGFTWGLATSYYDFYSSPATSFSVPWSSDTGDGGWKVAAYTAQFGNGVSGTISVEEPRRHSITNTTVASFGSLGAVPLNDQQKIVWPDIVANLRVDQAWGSAQIMGAVHQAGGGYYGTSFLAAGAAPGVCANPGVGTDCVGHPSDKVGFAVGAGVKINFPMIGPGDYFQAQVNYTQGASRYAALTQPAAGSPTIYGNGLGQGSSVGMGYASDAMYCGAGSNAAAVLNGAGATLCPAGGSSLQLTTAWGVNAAYEHFWTPALRTSLVGAYTAYSYNDAASNMMFLGGAANGAGTLATNCATLITGCSGFFDWSFWSISSRTQWNITKDFYVGLEGFYGHLNTMAKGQTVTVGGGAQPLALRTLNDQDVFVYRMRVHRDLVP